MCVESVCACVCVSVCVWCLPSCMSVCLSVCWHVPAYTCGLCTLNRPFMCAVCSSSQLVGSVHATAARASMSHSYLHLLHGHIPHVQSVYGLWVDWMSWWLYQGLYHHAGSTRAFILAYLQLVTGGVREPASHPQRSAAQAATGPTTPGVNQLGRIYFLPLTCCSRPQKVKQNPGSTTSLCFLSSKHGLVFRCH